MLDGFLDLVGQGKQHFLVLADKLNVDRRGFALVEGAAHQTAGVERELELVESRIIGETLAQKADVEGYNDVAAVFRSTAEGETGHAHGHLEFMEEVGDPATGKPIGSTDKNLVASVAGETHEYTDMYPGMARTARDEGFDEIADWFETLAKAERSHAGRFQRALGELK